MRNSSVEVDGIAGTLFEPDQEAAAVLVVHPATATPAGFYTGFAEFLAGHRIAAVTYDYRGTGRSGSPKRHRATGMRDWIERDVPAVTAWAARRFPGLPQFAVGHSVGGPALVIGLSDDPWATPVQVDRLAARLTGADVERRTYSPGSVGAIRIGHHGFMRRAMRDTLWTDLLTWFDKWL